MGIRIEKKEKKEKKQKNMKRLKRFKKIRRTLSGSTGMMFMALLLMTGCGTGQTTTSSGMYSGAEYQLTGDCALLHIYRPKSFAGMAMSYNLHLNEWVIADVRNKSKATVRVTAPGTYTLWAKTESREELPVEIQMGREYYIRCSIGLGILVGRPVIEYVDGITGKQEFDKIP
jgi:hypothetical protein